MSNARIHHAKAFGNETYSVEEETHAEFWNNLNLS